MPQPQLEPGVLVVTNCTECKGCGRDEEKDITCDVCDGSGRDVAEMPLSQVWEMAHRQHEKLVAPPPSMVRDEAVGGEGG